MRYFLIRILLFAYFGLSLALTLSAQLSREEFRQCKTTWENEDNKLQDRWDAANKLCKSHYFELNTDSAYYYATEYYESAVEVGDSSNIIDGLLSLSFVHGARGEYSQKISRLEEILKFTETSRDQTLVPTVNGDLASTYLVVGEAEKGIDYLFQALDSYFEIDKDSFSERDMMHLLFNIAYVYHLLGDGESALRYLSWVHAHGTNYLGGNNPRTELTNVGLTYFEMDDMPNAKKTFLKGLALGDTDDPAYARILIGLGSVYRKENQLDSSLHFLEKALPIMERTGQYPDEVLALGELGLVYVKKEEFGKARDYGLRALPKARLMNSTSHLVPVTEALYKAYKGLGELKLSLEYYEEYVEENDKIEARDVYLELKREEFTRMLEFKERSILAEFNDSRTTNRMILFLSIGGFILVLSLIVLYYSRRLWKRNRERRTLMAQIEALKEEGTESAPQTSKPELEKMDARTLDKDKIETTIDAKLNNTDWKILNALLNNPVITNKEIAEMIFLSVPGVRSSLQKMYRLFNIDGNSGNRRIALVLAAVRMSGE